ncbi:ATPase [Marinisporobacter balticus]|uniref:ATPase n=1 Tax=Marinisporobacter balticus TaxID=2018667 RepID=A0A4R2L4A5_9FIRM|nr:ATPase [Marinisporobacter balticus]TCO80077.1 hypothetical protein EV214_101316 [Marinisporobacter balticus]
MGKQGAIKKVFPGGNTAKGFYSYYDNIISTDANKLFIIKGGPGVGKSSFMKKVAFEILEKGYDVEFHQCSSDNNSLDGIVIQDLKIAIIDGTAPHVVDPKYPGAVDVILNFGEFWNEMGILKNKEEIIKVTSEIGKRFKRAYKFFAAAKSVRDDVEEIYEEALDHGSVNQSSRVLKKEIYGSLNDAQQEGKVRHLFGSALSPNGLVDYYETIVGTMKNIYYVDGSYVKGISRFIKGIVDEGIKKGLYIEAYHEPLDERNIETIIIPKLSIAITTSDKYAHTYYKKITFDTFMKQEILDMYVDALEEDKAFIENLIRAGIANITKAKKEHDSLEKSYVSNMNFKEVDDLREKIMKSILVYAKEIIK